jgi:predicted peptidase
MKAAALKDVPCWYFIGADDDVTPVQSAREMIATLNEAGGRPRFTEFAGVGHDCWDRAYDTDELYGWLLRQARR